MAFAIFYDDTDLAEIQKPVTLGGLTISQSDRQLFQRVWNGGLKNWVTAPYGQSSYEEPMPNAGIRRVVITSTVTLLEFREALYRVADDNPSFGYLKVLANDMGHNCGALEPWT